MARPASRPGNLPADATSFVGRRRELADVKRKLAEARLVTLVGPGGVGKTRLAMRAATDLTRLFRGGAWLVELAEIHDPGLVGHAVLAALDLRDQTTAEPLDLVLPYLRDKQLLLVVDNCEHLLGAAARLTAAVVKAAPGVRVIATSREPLSVPGEHVVPVPPLDLPSADPAVPLPQLRQNEAVSLFVERAVAGSGRFALTTANQAAVADLCRRLDGLPLAIELAAVRTRVLTAQQILDRLTDRFGLLTGGGPAVLPRHQTLSTTIDWSHDLLTAGEQALLRRLWVFAGRFTIEAVESVCTAGVVPPEHALDMLSSLVDKSLVHKEDVATLACYRLHETMREYAGLKLRAAGEREAIELRCADHYRERCRRSGAEARYRLVEWLDWMDLEIDNIRAVLQRCVAARDRRRGLDLAGSLGWYWVTRATSEGIRWLDELLAIDDGRPAPAMACFVRGFLAVLQSDPAAARPVLDHAVTAAREAGHASLESMSLAMTAIAEHMAGDRVAAARLIDAARDLSAGLDDYPTTIMLLQARALTGLFDGDARAARDASAEGIRLSRQVGDIYSLDMMLINLGCATMIGGSLDESRPLFTEALRIARQIDDRVAQYLLLDVLGALAADAGRARHAARLLGAAETVQVGVGARLLPSLAPVLARAEESTRDALGAAAFQTELQAGRRLTRPAAVALALDEPPPVTGTDAADPVAVPLGKREAEVAALVADGLSNKQIGARLFISEHTVDSHIRNIMNKLGCRSRAQIAAWMAASTR
jgi:predicted ATPase/DNA-binding CsgD family transcriptional regulator